MMKKTLVAILAAAMLFSATACGNKQTQTETNAAVEGNIIVQLQNKGYEVRSFTYSYDNDVPSFKALMYSSKKKDYQMVKLSMTDEEVKAFEALDYMAEGYREKEQEWLAGLAGEGSAESMESMMPTEEELGELVGKTGAELEEMGYEKCGMDFANNTLCLEYRFEKNEDIMYDISVLFEESEGKTLDDISDEIVLGWTVEKAEFLRFE